MDQGGTMTFWVADNGQRIKTISEIHPEAEVTCLCQDSKGTVLYTGATDGTIKVRTAAIIFMQVLLSFLWALSANKRMKICLTSLKL